MIIFEYAYAAYAQFKSFLSDAWVSTSQPEPAAADNTFGADMVMEFGADPVCITMEFGDDPVEMLMTLGDYPVRMTMEIQGT